MTDEPVPTPPKTGHRFVDMAAAAAAIVISLISLAVGIENSRIQERLLTASSWPMIQFYTSDVSGGDGGGKPVIAFGLRNSGVGPAKVESVTMSWHGRTYTDNLALLRDCCGALTPGDHYGHGLQSNTASPTVMQAGEQHSFLVLPRGEGDDPVWDKLDTASQDIKVSVCYCSVFDECWRSDGVSLRPARVKSCPAGPRFPR